MVAMALARICPPCWPRSRAVADPPALFRSIDLAPRHSPDGASEIQARPSPYRTATPALRFAPCGLRDQTRGAVKNSPFLDIVPALFQAQSSRLAEGVSGDEPAAEAGAAPAGGLTNRTRATTGHYDPDAVGAAAVERRKASAPIARGTGTPRKRPSAWLAPTPRCGSHPHRAPFRRSAPLYWGETKKVAQARAPRRPEAAKRAAEHWLYA